MGHRVFEEVTLGVEQRLDISQSWDLIIGCCIIGRSGSRGIRVDIMPKNFWSGTYEPLNARGRIAKGTTALTCQVLHGLFFLRRLNRGAFHGTDPGANPDDRQVIHNSFDQRRIGRIRAAVAGVEVAAIPRLFQQLAGFFGIVAIGLKRQGKVQFMGIILPERRE
jgi:hypothetical protein